MPEFNYIFAIKFSSLLYEGDTADKYGGTTLCISFIILSYIQCNDMYNEHILLSHICDTCKNKNIPNFTKLFHE